MGGLALPVLRMLLRVPLDEVQPRQVDTRKWLAFYSPFKLGICQSQMEYLQRVFHLIIKYPHRNIF